MQLSQSAQVINSGGCAGDPTCGFDQSCEMPSCDMPSCDGGCDSTCGFGDCDLGDPYALFGGLENLNVGGWVSMGYHDKAIPLFNSHPDRVNVHQAWLYAEKEIDTSNGFDIGGRIDYVYGVDAQDTQAFGIANNHWDNDWDHGIYGNAIPQLYAELGYGDLSVKLGHFYTIIGWEVVQAPDNFFYSHAYTFYNSEPFTHSGALGTYTPSEDVTVYGGYVMGWDSGFEDNGDAFLGGLSLTLTDQLTVTYAAIGGRFADENTGTLEQGYMHSVVADLALTDELQYIFQTDLLDTEDAGGNGVRESIGVNNYLIYTVNDCVSVGARYEWWQQNGIFNTFGTDTDIHALTIGMNYKPHANVTVRPEVRRDWDDDLVLGLEDGDSQTTFGIDTIFLF